MAELRSGRKLDVPLVTKEFQRPQVKRIPCKKKIIPLKESDMEGSAKDEQIQADFEKEAESEEWMDEEDPKEDSWMLWTWMNQNEDYTKEIIGSSEIGEEWRGRYA